jgi:RHS repeat-associated protein
VPASFNAQNQNVAQSYDHAGNLTINGTFAYAYDAWNELVSARNGGTTVAGYAYDALGRRIVESYPQSTTTNHLYYSPQWQVIEERRNGTANTDAKYQIVWSAAYIDALILRDTLSNGTLQPSQRLYVQQDANYDTTSIVASGGNVVERYEYDPYGVVTVLTRDWAPVPDNQSAVGWRYYHQGGRLDLQTGWYDFRARQLIPSEGRWNRRDPLGFTGTEHNLYRYLKDNPTEFRDPTGLAATIVIYIHTTSAPPGFNARDVQANLQAILSSGGGKTRILLIPTDKPREWYEDQYNLTLGWNYDRTAWLWNAGWWNVDPFCLVLNLGQRPFHWLFRERKFYIGHAQFTKATGAIGSHGANTAFINLGSLEGAGDALGFSPGSSTLYANIIFHELLYHGLVGGFDDPFASDNTFSSTTQNSQHLMTLTAAEAAKIDRRCESD